MATSSDGELWPRALHQSWLGAPCFWAALAPPVAANQETRHLAVCLGLGNKLIKISIYFFSLVPRGRRVFSCDVEMCPSCPGRPGSRRLCQSASEGPRILPSTPRPVSNGGGPAASGRMRAPGGSCCSACSWARPSRGHGAGPRQSPETSSFNKLPRRFMWQVTRILPLVWPFSRPLINPLNKQWLIPTVSRFIKLSIWNKGGCPLSRLKKKIYQSRKQESE